MEENASTATDNGCPPGLKQDDVTSAWGEWMGELLRECAKQALKVT